jgi:hypothetical protein
MNDLFRDDCFLKNSGLYQILQQRASLIITPASWWPNLIAVKNTVKNFKKSYQGMELKTPMTENLKVKASQAVDDARVAAHAVYDDATVAAHNTLKDASVEAQKVSDDVQMGVHKAVADAKIAVHEAGSKMKKR